MISLDRGKVYWGRSVSVGAVLGHYPAYLEAADKRALSCFHLGGAELDDLSNQECWRRNRAFLDRIIAARQSVILVTPVNRINPASWFAREIGYLEGRGYRLTADESMMVPSIDFAP